MQAIIAVIYLLLAAAGVLLLAYWTDRRNKG